MADIFSTPYVADVGQFGADNSNVERYKQAAEYAADSEYWAKLSQESYATLDDFIEVVRTLYEQGILLAADIDQLKLDFAKQKADLLLLVQQSQTAVSNANNAVALINQKIIEINKELDIIKSIHVTVSTVEADVPAGGSYNNTTGELHLDIPKGVPGSVTDLSTTPIGVPLDTDLGFYVDSAGAVHKTLISDIAKTFPSVQSVSVQNNAGVGAKETGDVIVNPTKLGLGNVNNVSSYSKAESDSHTTGFIKPYDTLAEAQADAEFRSVGEMVLVWADYSYDLYNVIAGATSTDKNVLSATPIKSEPRVLKVNNRSPVDGNISIDLPQGNPALYIGEMLMFPHNPTTPISYPGIHIANGSQVLRANETDLIADLQSGSVPVVTEAEWQAGARSYFSWGEDKAGVPASATVGDYIRLPDWTTGEALRTPSSTDDASYKGEKFAQIPYIVTINGQGPQPDGSITLLLADVDANGANSNIKSFTSKVNVPNGTDRSNIANYGQLLDAVADVKDDVIPLTRGGTGAITSDTGRVALSAAKSGVNNDITSITGLTTALSVAQGGTGATSVANSPFADKTPAVLKAIVGSNGPLTLGAAAQGQFDAVTLAQLQASSGGTGASLNGVMNNFIGAVEWWAGTRAKMPAGYVEADGQVLTRAAYPDLWAAIAAGVLGGTTDAAWLAAPTARGNYSYGPNGGTTTTGTSFRMPDLNGKQRTGVAGFTDVSSIHALFLRGDGVDASDNAGSGSGVIRQNAAPNITGAIQKIANISGIGASGSLSASPTDLTNLVTGTQSASYNINLNAATSSAAYGRDNTPEVRPNSVTGVWIVRASGAYVSANTNFNVIQSLSAAPPTNSEGAGGDIISDYQVTGTSVAKATFRVSKITGATTSLANLIVGNTGGTPASSTFKFASNGDMSISGVFNSSGSISAGGTTYSGVGFKRNVPASAQDVVTYNDTNNQPVTEYRSYLDNITNSAGGSGQIYYYSISGVRSAFVFKGDNQTVPFQLQSNGIGLATTWTSLSDERYKENIKRIQDPLDKMKAIKGVTFDWKNPSQGKSLGLIAQDVQKVLPEAVIDQGEYLSLNVSGVAAALHHEAILALMEQIDSLKAEIASLKNK